jgi:hypothetical protein
MTDAADQKELLRVAFQRLGHAAQQTAAGMAEAFAAAAQRLELERWKRAEARREAQWHRQQEKNILRQQLDRDTSYFGRKRRARRARGRSIEARRNPPYVGGRIWLARQTFARVRAGGAPLPRVMLDEIDSFLDPSLGEPWEEQADV